MNVKEISVQCVNNSGISQVIIKADGREIGAFIKKELNPGGVMAFMVTPQGEDFEAIPRDWENEDGSLSVMVDDFLISAQDEEIEITNAIDGMRAEVREFKAMSNEDILDMVDYCCELKRRIVKRVQAVRNEKFIKAIHSDYFAKSTF